MTEKHNGFYSYEKWDHPLCRENGVITCPIHGDFPQTFNNHYHYGKGCPKCGVIKGTEKVKKAWANQSKEYMEKWSRDTSERTKELWENPTYREKVSKGISKAFQNDPERRERYSQRMAEYNMRNPQVNVSKGVQYIVDILQSWGIEYQGGEDMSKEFMIPNTGYRFDFYLPDYNLFIEYHGEQHYRGWKGKKENLKKKQRNDAFKAQWAEDNGYDLLVIPYRDIKNIEPILAEVLGR